MRQKIFSLLMENKPGALMRVTGLFSQRGYNIESLTVSRTLRSHVITRDNYGGAWTEACRRG